MSPEVNVFIYDELSRNIPRGEQYLHFVPDSLTVARGTDVIFMNKGGLAHNWEPVDTGQTAVLVYPGGFAGASFRMEWWVGKTWTFALDWPEDRDEYPSPGVTCTVFVTAE